MLENITSLILRGVTSQDNVREQEKVVNEMTLEQRQALATKYIDPNRMYYVIAGDAATQMDALGKLGFGEPEMVK